MDVFWLGDFVGIFYYVISGFVFIIVEEDDDCELVLGYFGFGEFVGEMGLFVELDWCEVILCIWILCELVEISYECLYQLFLGLLFIDVLWLLYVIGQQIFKCLFDISCKVSCLVFLDVIDCIVCIFYDLFCELEVMSYL